MVSRAEQDRQAWRANMRIRPVIVVKKPSRNSKRVPAALSLNSFRPSSKRVPTMPKLKFMEEEGS